MYDADADISGVVAGTNVGACVAPSGPACHSAFFTPNIKYRYIRGSVLGVSFGEVCAFGGAGRSNKLNGESLFT